MNEQQNADGTWSKAEPIKASLEDNKILRFFRKLSSKEKCFEEYKGEDGKCHGLYGGDRFTDYLDYGCVGCKHLDLIVRIKNDGGKRK